MELDIPSHEKAFQSQLIVMFHLLAKESENYWRKLAYPEKTQNGSPRITDVSKMLMSASISKCHKMLLMSHFNKTVMNIGYYHHQEYANRDMDQEFKYCGN